MAEPSEYLQHLVKKEFEAKEAQEERLHNEYVNKVLKSFRRELTRANSIHQVQFNSENEAIGVVLEEFEELKEALLHGSIHHAREEAIQLGAMALKTILFIDDKIRKGEKDD